MSSIQARRPHNDLPKGQRHGKKGRIRKTLAIAIAMSSVGAIALKAQSDGTLARVQVVSTKGGAGCPVLLINFNEDLTSGPQSFTDGGQTFVVRLKHDIQASKVAAREQIETEPVVTVPRLGTAFVSLDNSGDEPVMSVHFSALPPRTKVIQAGAKSLVITLFGDDDAACQDHSAPRDDQALPSPTSADAGTRDDGTDTPRLYADARSAVTARQYDRAIAILTKILSGPETSFAADAQELLGIARERNGQLAHAKAEYDTYLQKYPSGPGADRVRQRLQAMATATAAPPGSLTEPGPDKNYTTADIKPGEVRITSIPRRNERFPPLKGHPIRRVWNSVARIGDRVFSPDNKAIAERKARDRVDDPPRISVTLSYNLNQSSTRISELIDHTSETDNEILQNALILSFDVSDSVRKNGRVYSYRFNGDYQQDFTKADNSHLNLSRFYGELSMGTDGPVISLGRQSWYDDATLGRYDGVRVRYNVSEDVRLTGIVGVGVDRKSDPMFGGDTQVMGVTASYLGFGKNTELTGFVIREATKGFTDRMVTGAEASFSNSSDSANGLFEYDLSFGTLSRARASWSHRFENRSSFSLTAEYDHSPSLSLSSALVGQSVTTLTDLSAIYTLAEMRQLALDRSPENLALSGSWQKPLSDRWQVSVDGTAYQTADAPASGGVAAVAAQGTAFHASAQVVGTSVFAKNDVFSLSVRGADNAPSKLAMIDGYWRYNINKKLRVKPRLQLAHRTFANGSGSENFAIPSVTLNYELNDNNELELEVGGRLSNRDTPTFVEETNSFYLSAAFTRDF